MKTKRIKGFRFRVFYPSKYFSYGFSISLAFFSGSHITNQIWWRSSPHNSCLVTKKIKIENWEKLRGKEKKNQEENKKSLKIYYGISREEINLFPYVSSLINPKKKCIYI